MDQFYAALWTYFAPPLTVIKSVDPPPGKMEKEEPMRNLLIATVAVAMLAGCEAMPTPPSTGDAKLAGGACQTCFFAGTKYSDGADRGNQTCSCYKDSGCRWQ